MSEARSGACECGAVSYQVTGEPKAVVICHCRSCQRQSGSAFGMSMVFAADGFQILSGELQVFERQADSGATLRCFFCPHCGVRIYHQKADISDTIILKPGTLDDARAVTPKRQLWLAQKQGWIDLSGLPGFERQSA